ncbi:hypothetical protein GUITHDRAFT_139405 [Guillardia theta CCMP2712]|uniref:RRM domain-containing protein n=1 Tax=Guillardia theta (strain CCMP2712) TaxID=905079 RepID=L1J906_GUITC|nr:hypothetical protein GUITHDRAFT_139405 [Guillardia theta CCMP2712]EKX44777.1 hypothetical protein GUITHDRAFT_139405 [Guillardia theta CCMP2712]|eukprot:XP_005831757.1 hypothetical protein GUITHDRAFT_139405 [Guillardia theta CCMP2712]
MVVQEMGLSLKEQITITDKENDMNVSMQHFLASEQGACDIIQSMSLKEEPDTSQTMFLTAIGEESHPSDLKQVPDQSMSSDQSEGSRHPRLERQIFVGGLPTDVTNTTFREWADETFAGRVVNAVLVVDRLTHSRSRGFGFITFDSVEVAEEAARQRLLAFNDRTVEVKRAQNISSLQKGKEGQATDNTNKKESTRKTSQKTDQASARTGSTKQGKGCEVKGKGSDGSKQEGGYSRRVSQGGGRSLNGREGRAGSRFENRNAYEESFQERRYGIMDVGMGMGMPPLHVMPQAQSWAEMQGQMGQWMVPQPQEMMHPACFYPAGAGGI